MPDESQSFASTRARLDDIVMQVRKKDTSLEKSLDLLEEGVRLANLCTELIDHADWDAAEMAEPEDESAAVSNEAPEGGPDGAGQDGSGTVHVTDVEPQDAQGDSEDV